MLLHRDCRKNVRIFGAVQRVSLAQLDFYFYGIAGLEGGGLRFPARSLLCLSKEFHDVLARFDPCLRCQPFRTGL
jgi:hypothetical protein